MFTRIIVGDDGGPEARDAVVLGAAIARATGAGLTLLQSYSPILIPTPGLTDRETLAGEARRKLAADRRLLAPEAHIDAVADAHPARALIHEAESWHANLIVIGSSRHAAMGRSAIGSTGRELIERGATALIIARRGLHKQEARLATVAVGYDGGPESNIALHYADQIAARAGAELLITSIVRNPVSVSLLRNGVLTAQEELDELAERERLEAFELCSDSARRTAAKSRPDVRLGDPRTDLRSVSDEVDLMVIGSRRWGLLPRVVLGGVGEALVSDCGTSLLITQAAVRDPAQVPVPTTHGQEN